MRVIYLSDKELKQRLYGDVEDYKKLTIVSREEDFSIEKQVGICSIDLKLSPQVWEEKRRVFGKRRLIDLGNTFFDNQIHLKYWEEKTLSKDGYILKPGQRVLARVDEDIHMPLDCLGKIESRSGINRLLLIVALGDFVNPGYKGHYPLQVINMSKHTIKIYPKMSVCQLLLSKLSTIPEKEFSKSLSSYYYDDGGPACWWEDRQLKLFMKENANLEKQYVERLISICEKNNLNDYSSIILSRYRKFYKKCKNKNKNLEHSVDDFLKHEKKTDNKVQLYIKLMRAIQYLVSSLASIGTIIGGIVSYQRINRITMQTGIILGAIIVFVFIVNLVLVAGIHKLEQVKYLKDS